MRADRIRLSDLTTWEQCLEARDSIESDPVNIQGGIAAWNSGCEVHLKNVAQRKVDAIERKMDKLTEEEGESGA